MLEGQVETQFGRIRLGKNQYQGHTLLKNHNKTRRHKRSDEVWNLGRCSQNTYAIVSCIFIQLRTFVVVPDVLSKYSKIGNAIFFRCSV